MFGHVIMPRAVAEELQHPQTPTVVHIWMATPSTWLDIRDLGTAPDATLAHLDPGEQEAIALPQALPADLLLMDAWEGQQEAKRHSLAVTGVLGVLERAVQQGWLALPSALTRLLATNFYTPANVIRDILTRDVARKSRSPH